MSGVYKEGTSRSRRLALGLMLALSAAPLIAAVLLDASGQQSSLMSRYYNERTELSLAQKYADF